MDNMLDLFVTPNNQPPIRIGFVEVGEGCQIGTLTEPLFIRNGDLDIPVDASKFEVVIRPVGKKN